MVYKCLYEITTFKCPELITQQPFAENQSYRLGAAFVITNSEYTCFCFSDIYICFLSFTLN